jgi:hypothetical protein
LHGRLGPSSCRSWSCGSYQAHPGSGAYLKGEKGDWRPAHCATRDRLPTSVTYRWRATLASLQSISLYVIQRLPKHTEYAQWIWDMCAAHCRSVGDELQREMKHSSAVVSPIPLLCNLLPPPGGKPQQPPGNRHTVVLDRTAVTKRTSFPCPCLCHWSPMYPHALLPLRLGDHLQQLQQLQQRRKAATLHCCRGHFHHAISLAFENEGHMYCC